MRRLFAVPFALLTACGSSPPPHPAGEPPPVASGDTDRTVAPPAGDSRLTPPPSPPAAPVRWAPPAEPPVTVDVSPELDAVLEPDQLAGACDALDAGATDRATRLRCGKWMFFYETFGTIGVPANILRFLQKHYADSFYGDGFENLGFVKDPSDPDGMPIGLAETTGQIGNLETRAFTCAACHFGRMPDGRYAVGYGNMQLQYGLFLASLGAPLTLSTDPNSADVHPDLRAMLAEPVAVAKTAPGYDIDVAILGLDLLLNTDGAVDTGGVAEQEQFLGLLPGTMDFMTKPLLDDGVWTVSRILSLWNIPDADQRAAADMPHELLSWTGGVHALNNFLSGFVAIGVSDDEWADARLAPLADYVASLRTPELLTVLDPAAVERGARLFESGGCSACHLGPSGEGNRAFTFDEVETDPALAAIFNPTGDELCCGLGAGDDYDITRGVKAPRLTGLENLDRFLHNGAVGSLEELLCLEPRQPYGGVGQTSTGHWYGCWDLGETEREDIATYLRSL